MKIEEQIHDYISSQPGPKQSEMRELHTLILKLAPNARLWFLDGKNDHGKIVSNPNIGYGSYEMKYAGGKTREFYRIGLSANTTGISVYVMGIENKKWLAEAYGKRLGRASVTGYCIKFRTIAEINLDVLEEAIGFGLRQG